jgi:hypothetical protein
MGTVAGSGAKGPGFDELICCGLVKAWPLIDQSECAPWLNMRLLQVVYLGSFKQDMPQEVSSQSPRLWEAHSTT